MKVTFIGHASIFIETHGITILSDPWWKGPCFGAQWWLYPEPFIEVLHKQKIDYIYISHGHHDHFHPSTLNSLSRDSTVLIARGLDLRDHIEKMGFSVIEVKPDEVFQLKSNVLARIRETKNGDTLMTVFDGEEVCANLNDAVHALDRFERANIISWLKHQHPIIDYLFCGYGTASHFPNCYEVPGMDKEKTAAKRQSYFNHIWADIAQEINPRYAFPFAADFVFLEKELFWANQPVHNFERPTDVFCHTHQHSPLKTQTQAIDIAPGFTINRGKVEKDIRFRPVKDEEVLGYYKNSEKKINNLAMVKPISVHEVTKLFRQNLEENLFYFKSFPRNYRFLIRFRNSTEAIEIAKTKETIRVENISLATSNQNQYDLIYTTRLAYLKKSISSHYGNEILFVGSGGIFHYPDPKKISMQFHLELRMMLVAATASRKARRISYTPLQKLFNVLKNHAKKILGKTSADLYNLEDWVVMSTRTK